MKIISKGLLLLLQLLLCCVFGIIALGWIIVFGIMKSLALLFGTISQFMLGMMKGFKIGFERSWKLGKQKGTKKRRNIVVGYSNRSNFVN